MPEKEYDQTPLTQWAANVKVWVTLVMILASTLVGAVMELSGMKQQIALLNQRLEIITSNQEQRISALETSEKTQNSKIDWLTAKYEK